MPQHFDKGVNLIGYIRSETGVGQSCRLAAEALDSTDVPFLILNYQNGDPSYNTDLSWSHREAVFPRHPINILHVNANEIPAFFAHYGQPFFAGIYQIGYWHWELPDFPDRYASSFSYLDEVWVPTHFVQQAIAPKSPKPVIRIPHGIRIQLTSSYQREHFGLPVDRFLFLCMYSTHSFHERKNPMGAVEAFQRAFSPDDRSVGLVIKINHETNDITEVDKLKAQVQAYTNIFFLEGTMAREQVNALIQLTDAYISLHRSEGFGLGLAEAMYARKAAIGTNWSGNVDFMNSSNSCLIHYRLVPLNRDYGPYGAYQFWAEPDLEHAAYYMRRLVQDSPYYDQICQAGQQTILTNYSPHVAGELAKTRLMHLGLL